MDSNNEDLEKIFSALHLKFENDEALTNLIKKIEDALAKTNLWGENADPNRSGNPDRIYLSGSLKKNTAIKKKFDINFVVFAYCRGLHEFLSMKSKFNEAIKKTLKEEIQVDSYIEDNFFVVAKIDNYTVKIVVALTTLRKWDIVENTDEYKNSAAMDSLEKIKSSLKPPKKSTELYFSGEIGESVTMVACRKETDYQKFQIKKKDILNEMKKIFLEKFKLSDKKVKVTGSVEFEHNGITFRILPGLMKNDHELHPGTQHLVTLDIAERKMNPKTVLKILQHSMAELEDQFVNDQDEFIRKLIVLLKQIGKSELIQSEHPNATTQKKKYTSRKLELIAIHVGQKITKCWEERNLFVAFTQCLQFCAEIEKSLIEFDYPPNKRYFDEKIWSPPYIRDPINPHNNVLPRTEDEGFDENDDKTKKSNLKKAHEEFLRGVAERAQKILKDVIYGQTKEIKLRALFGLAGDAESDSQAPSVE